MIIRCTFFLLAVSQNRLVESPVDEIELIIPVSTYHTVLTALRIPVWFMSGMMTRATMHPLFPRHAVWARTNFV